MAIIINEPTLLDNILYYGLFIGALFQLACIFAVVFIPQSENEEEIVEASPDSKPSPPQPIGTSGVKKSGKREKKKHR